jgi:hypothetical protein
MRAELAARLRCAMRGDTLAKNGVTGVSGVTAPLGLRLKPPELRQLRLENYDRGKTTNEGVTATVNVSGAMDFDAIEELLRWRPIAFRTAISMPGHTFNAGGLYWLT